MRKIRFLSIAIFLSALTAFGAYKFYNVKNKDLAGPKITMNEETVTVSVGVAEDELLAGVTAEDKKDGDVTDSLLVESMSNFVEKGRRMITIAAFDSDNHVTKTTREVIYSDYHSPRLSLEKPLKFQLNETNILSGVSVEDVLDGDLTANIKISGDYYIRADQEGEYPVVLSVANSAGDVAEFPVTVQIYTPSGEPEILLSEYLVYTAPGAAVNPWDYVQQITIGGIDYVRDEEGVLRDPNPGENQDRTLIAQEEIQIGHNIDYNTPGVYEIIYQISEENGKSGSVRLIVVVSE